jgi:hypothetical protein
MLHEGTQLTVQSANENVLRKKRRYPFLSTGFFYVALSSIHGVLFPIFLRFIITVADICLRFHEMRGIS